MKAFSLTVSVVLIVVGFWFWRGSPPTKPDSVVEQTAAPVTAVVPGASPAFESPVAPPAVARPGSAPLAADVPPTSAPSVPQRIGQAPPMPMPDGAITTPVAAGDGEINPEQIAADLDSLSLSLRDYRTLMAQNPVGTNSEITEALMGNNRKSARLAPQDVRMNGKGEMVDRWGVPYFFHQLSATSMEIHSAGPDKKMGTDDDIIHR